MRKGRFASIVAVSVAALSVFASGAAAGPRVSASGTVSYLTGITSVTTAGSNTIYSIQNPATWTGTLSGSGTLTGTLVIHADGSFNFHGTTVFVGAVAGCGSGTLVFNSEGNGSVNGVDVVFDKDSYTTRLGQGTLPVNANIDAPGFAAGGLLGGTLAYTGTYDC